MVGPFTCEQRRAASFVRRGPAEVARCALTFALPSAVLRPALVNGARVLS